MKHQKLRQEIAQALEAGQAKEVLFHQFKDRGLSDFALAGCLLRLASPTRKARYRYARFALLGLMVGYAVLRFVFSQSAFAPLFSPWLKFAIPVGYLYFALGIAFWKYTSFRYAILFAVGDLFSLPKEIGAFPPAMITIAGMQLLGILGLTIFLFRQLFPALPWNGRPLKIGPRHFKLQ